MGQGGDVAWGLFEILSLLAQPFAQEIDIDFVHVVFRLFDGQSRSHTGSFARYHRRRHDTQAAQGLFVGRDATTRGEQVFHALRGQDAVRYAVRLAPAVVLGLVAGDMHVDKVAVTSDFVVEALALQPVLQGEDVEMFTSGDENLDQGVNHGDAI